MGSAVSLTFPCTTAEKLVGCEDFGAALPGPAAAPLVSSVGVGGKYTRSLLRGMVAVEGGTNTMLPRPVAGVTRSASVMSIMLKGRGEIMDEPPLPYDDPLKTLDAAELGIGDRRWLAVVGVVSSSTAGDLAASASSSFRVRSLLLRFLGFSDSPAAGEEGRGCVADVTPAGVVRVPAEEGVTGDCCWARLSKDCRPASPKAAWLGAGDWTTIVGAATGAGVSSIGDSAMVAGSSVMTAGVGDCGEAGFDSPFSTSGCMTILLLFTNGVGESGSLTPTSTSVFSEAFRAVSSTCANGAARLMGCLNALPSDVVDSVGEPSGGSADSGEPGGDPYAGETIGLYSRPSSSLVALLTENERRLLRSLKFISGDPLLNPIDDPERLGGWLPWLPKRTGCGIRFP